MPRPRTSLGTLRIITVMTADIFLLSCTITALILPYLPIRYDIWGLASHYSLYLQISAIVTMVGLWGCFRKQPKLTRFFSRYIIFDLFLSALPRFLLLISIFKMEPETSDNFQTNEAPVILTSRIADPSGIPLLDAIITELIVTITSQYRHATANLSSTEYFIFASILKVGFVVILGLCSGMQVAASRCIGEYTVRLERLQEDALSEAGKTWGGSHGGEEGKGRRLSEPWRMCDSDLEEWEEYRDTVDEKVA